MRPTSNLRKIVRSTLEECFPKLTIVRINFSDDMSDDADPILRIKVIYDANDRDFDPAEIRELPRLILPKLAKAHEPGFPVFSFIAKSDLGALSPEAG